MDGNDIDEINSEEQIDKKGRNSNSRRGEDYNNHNRTPNKSIKKRLFKVFYWIGKERNTS
jgi:hypothetical protein